MPLPKISTPSYELVIPSTKKKIKFRPFLVKEEKILIIAMESQDNKQIANAIKDVLSACILSRGVKVNDLSTFDIEYLFLNIRGKSVGEEVEVMITFPVLSHCFTSNGLTHTTRGVTDVHESHQCNWV